MHAGQGQRGQHKTTGDKKLLKEILQGRYPNGSKGCDEIFQRGLFVPWFSPSWQVDVHPGSQPVEQLRCALISPRESGRASLPSPGMRISPR